MRAAVLREIGKLPRVEDFQEPTPGDGEVLIHVSAAALKPVDRQLASGTHYASPRELPVVCGSDGVGRTDDDRRVFFGGPRRPYGSMAERTVVRKAQCFPIPESVDDGTAAAITNPGVSAWVSLERGALWRRGETERSSRASLNLAQTQQCRWTADVKSLSKPSAASLGKKAWT